MEKQAGQNSGSGDEARTSVEAACAKAPTLLAGEDGNCRGEVRVWAPDRRRIQCATTVASTVTAALLALSLAHPTGHYSPVWTVIPVLMFYFFVKELRRRCVVMTDAMGIGFTSKRRGCAYRWKNIQVAEWEQVSGHFLLIGSTCRNIIITIPTITRFGIPPGDQILMGWEPSDYIREQYAMIHLAGHTPQAQDELFKLITARSHLERDPVNRDRYIRHSDSAVPFLRDLRRSRKDREDEAAAARQIDIVTILGAVKKPRVLVYSPGMRVRDVVSTAGGCTRNADLSRSRLSRRVVSDDGDMVFAPPVVIRLDLILAGHPEHDMKLEAGDLIFVPQKRSSPRPGIGGQGEPTVPIHKG